MSLNLLDNYLLYSKYLSAVFSVRKNLFVNACRRNYYSF